MGHFPHDIANAFGRKADPEAHVFWILKANISLVRLNSFTCGSGCSEAGGAPQRDPGPEDRGFCPIPAPPHPKALAEQMQCPRLERGAGSTRHAALPRGLRDMMPVEHVAKCRARVGFQRTAGTAEVLRSSSCVSPSRNSRLHRGAEPRQHKSKRVRDSV